MKASQLIRDLATEIANHGDREIVFHLDGNNQRQSRYEILPYLPTIKKIIIQIW